MQTSRSLERSTFRTFTAAGMTLLCRMALVVDVGVVTKVFYPVFPPDKSADEVVSWLQQNDRPSVLLPVSRQGANNEIRARGDALTLIEKD